jgi:hypothetical protein
MGFSRARPASFERPNVRLGALAAGRSPSSGPSKIGKRNTRMLVADAVAANRRKVISIE